MVNAETGEITAGPKATDLIAPRVPEVTEESAIRQFRSGCERICLLIADRSVPLASLPDDLAEIKRVANAVYRFWKDCEAIVIARMREAGMSATGDHRVGHAILLKEKKNYVYNEPVLKRLAALIDVPDGITLREYEDAMAYIFKPDKRLLNDLKKRGTKVAEIIAAGVSESDPSYSLEIYGGSQ